MTLAERGSRQIGTWHGHGQIVEMLFEAGKAARSKGATKKSSRTRGWDPSSAVCKEASGEEGPIQAR